jgi:hypothetical protein
MNTLVINQVEDLIRISWKLISEFKNKGWIVSCPYFRSNGIMCISCEYPGKDIPGLSQYAFFKIKDQEMTIIYTGYHIDFTMIRDNSIEMDIFDALDSAIKFIFDISESYNHPRGFYFLSSTNWIS